MRFEISCEFWRRGGAEADDTTGMCCTPSPPPASVVMDIAVADDVCAFVQRRGKRAPARSDPDPNTIGNGNRTNGWRRRGHAHPRNSVRHNPSRRLRPARRRAGAGPVRGTARDTTRSATACGEYTAGRFLEDGAEAAALRKRIGATLTVITVVVLGSVVRLSPPAFGSGDGQGQGRQGQ